MENATQTATWNLDATHSVIGFKVKHMMISTVSGNFREFSAGAQAQSDDFTNAEFSFTARVDSIDTRNTDRDNHLKSADFFDAENHPELTFRSSSFDGSVMKGEMTIKGVTREIELDVEFNGVATDPYGQVKAGFEISGKINRQDFGLSWSAITEAGKIVVSDEVKFTADLQFVKA